MAALYSTLALIHHWSAGLSRGDLCQDNPRLSRSREEARMKPARLSLALAFVGLVAPGVAAVDFEFRIPPVIVQPGEEATIEFQIVKTGAFLPIDGWSFGLRHDPAQAELVSTTACFLPSVDPDFQSTQVYIDGFTVEVLFPAGTAASPFCIHRATYLPLVGDEEVVVLTDGATLPSGPPPTVWSDGVPYSAALPGGMITVKEPSFRFRARDVEVPASPGVDPGVISVPITMEQIEPGPPLGTLGFALGISHDPSLLNSLDFLPSPVLARMNSGAGPDFFSVVPFTDGITAGVLYSFFSSITLEVPDPTEVLIARYEALPAAVSSYATVDLNFSDMLGLPPVQTFVQVEMTALDAVTESGSIRFFPIPFVRADVNDDGDVDLSDGVSILEVLFSSRRSSCLDAADVNLDLSVDLSDSIALFSHLFLGASPPSSPFPNCGVAPTTLGCESYTSCP